MPADETGPLDDTGDGTGDDTGDDTGRRRASLAIVVGGGALLVALFALPWHHYAISVTGAGSFALDRNGVQSPDERLGLAAVVVTGALLALSALNLLSPPPVRKRLARADIVAWFGGPLLLALLGLKVLKNTNYLGIGAWVCVVLGVIVAASALRFRPATAGP